MSENYGTTIETLQQQLAEANECNAKARDHAKNFQARINAVSQTYTEALIERDKALAERDAVNAKLETANYNGARTFQNLQAARSELLSAQALAELRGEMMRKLLRFQSNVEVMGEWEALEMNAGLLKKERAKQKDLYNEANDALTTTPAEALKAHDAKLLEPLRKALRSYMECVQLFGSWLDHWSIRVNKDTSEVYGAWDDVREKAKINEQAARAAIAQKEEK